MLHFIADSVDVSLLECCASGASVGLSQIGQAVVHPVFNVESFAGAKVLPLQTASDHVHHFFFLSNAEVDPVVHHLPDFVELLGGNMESENVF